MDFRAKLHEDPTSITSKFYQILSLIPSSARHLFHTEVENCFVGCLWLLGVAISPAIIPRLRFYIDVKFQPVNASPQLEAAATHHGCDVKGQAGVLKGETKR